MKVVAKTAAMARLADRWRGQGRSIGFVPTMGALHEGHASLVRRARRENERVVVSIFVNPKQFAPNEDFARYPRTFAADRRLCGELGADALFSPSAGEIYPPGFSTTVSLPSLSEVLCGEFRPGHFQGVATVVLKLLEICAPKRAYFGEKDFQQLVVIRRLAEDLALRCRIVACPTLREKDGLAMSSRNRYLSPAERAVAPAIHAALKEGAASARRGQSAAALERLIARRIARETGAKIDYVSVADPTTLRKVPLIGGRLRLLAAARLGKTRLIDNIAFSC